MAILNVALSELHEIRSSISGFTIYLFFCLPILSRVHQYRGNTDLLPYSVICIWNSIHLDYYKSDRLFIFVILICMS